MKRHPIVQDLLAEIEDYCARSGINRTNFGTQAMRDGNFIPRLEAGRIPTFKTVERVRAFIEKNSKATKPKRTPRETLRHLIDIATRDSRGRRRAHRAGED